MQTLKTRAAADEIKQTTLCSRGKIEAENADLENKSCCRPNLAPWALPLLEQADQDRKTTKAEKIGDRMTMPSTGLEPRVEQNKTLSGSRLQLQENKTGSMREKSGLGA
jgi:hypothetical protein